MVKTMINTYDCKFAEHSKGTKWGQQPKIGTFQYPVPPFSVGISVKNWNRPAKVGERWSPYILLPSFFRPA